MHIVFLEPLGICGCAANSLLADLKKNGNTVKIYEDRNEEEAELVKRAQGADIVAVSNIPLRKSFFDQCPDLKLVSVAFTGLDHIDLEECKRRGITVMNAAGYSTHAVAELAIGMMIAVYRKIVGGDTITRIGGTRESFLGSELYGKTVGIIGVGAIGRQVAMVLHAFGCRVIAYNRSPKEIDYIRFVDKETLFKESDIVTVHIPLNSETKDFIGERELALMPPHAILINTARGPVVNRDALCDALCKGRIAGAAVDVYEQEPPLPAAYELFNAPNLLMLPHMGYATKEAFAERLKIVIRNIEEWLSINNNK
ncbi:hydroxyacid dehydrogenase [Porphyromonadaceae bacterium OttesenSCG-928-L07]|nr:hydroxyacid dehydrogenase [Porphyromonadaceae bacterium OttesenSCG-928-L07]MDL2251612.1 hydroxyacid dehydrogenase [Odoribacter sp. OttesenSCG-928-J03]MDL2330688.1 hydroxyacid dehydrogenase [Odoribacter sp. OttesenSCG-928-A06]